MKRQQVAMVKCGNLSVRLHRHDKTPEHEVPPRGAHEHKRDPLPQWAIRLPGGWRRAHSGGQAAKVTDGMALDDGALVLEKYEAVKTS